MQHTQSKRESVCECMCLCVMCQGCVWGMGGWGTAGCLHARVHLCMLVAVFYCVHLFAAVM